TRRLTWCSTSFSRTKILIPFPCSASNSAVIVQFGLGHWPSMHMRRQPVTRVQIPVTAPFFLWQRGGKVLCVLRGSGLDAGSASGAPLYARNVVQNLVEYLGIGVRVVYLDCSVPYWHVSAGKECGPAIERDIFVRDGVMSEVNSVGKQLVVDLRRSQRNVVCVGDVKCQLQVERLLALTS